MPPVTKIADVPRISETVAAGCGCSEAKAESDRRNRAIVPYLNGNVLTQNRNIPVSKRNGLI